MNRPNKCKYPRKLANCNEMKMKIMKKIQLIFPVKKKNYVLSYSETYS